MRPIDPMADKQDLQNQVAQAPAVTSAPAMPQAMPAATPVPQSELQLMPTPTPVQAAPAQPTIETPQLDKAMQLGAQLATEEQAFEKGYQNELQTQLKKDIDEAQVRESQIQDKLVKAQETLDGLANNKIDPNRLFKDNKWYQNLGLVLLSAAAGPKAGEIIQRRIENDIAAQEKEINSKFTFASNYLKEMQDAYKDTKQAKDALRASMYQAAQLKLEEVASKTKNQAVLMNAQAQIGELELKKQEALASLSQKAGLQASMQQMQASDPITAKILQFPEKLQTALLEAKEVYDNTNAALKSIDDSYAAAKDIGLSGKIPLTQAKATVDAENAKIESAIRATMKGQGTIQESEIERLVKPFLIDSTDTAARRQIKQKKLKELLVTKNSGQISRLKNVGILNKDPGGSAAKTLKKN